MIQVTRHGYKAFLKGACEICGCEVVCGYEDTFDKPSGSERYVKCPECGGTIMVKYDRTSVDMLLDGQYVQCGQGQNGVRLEGSRTAVQGCPVAVSVGDGSRPDTTTEARINAKYIQYCAARDADHDKKVIAATTPRAE